MSLQKLKAELTTDPLSRGYSGMSDDAVSTDVLTSYRTRNQPITSAELLAWSAASDRFKKLKEASDDTAHRVHSVAAAAYVMLNRDDTSLDLDLSDRMSLVDALVTGGVLTAADKTSLQALAKVSISRAEELSFGRCRPGEVAMARAM